ncbi:MAG: hypothetical protein KAS11_02985 [Candidatus Aenigmarchaeota archaeon]|nr:hypothetical protein [Candidatus Aenigmarchaeota archaeon]
MDENQIKTMLRIAREAGNFRELRRLEKIVRFHDPNFRYSTNRGHKRYLNDSLFEKVRKTNSPRFVSA